MHTEVLLISNRIVHFGCIHNLEKECIILNEKLGDCSIEDEGIIQSMISLKMVND